jgi:hypothetical protein
MKVPKPLCFEQITNPQAGDIVTLIAKSKHGSEVIKRHGATWRIIRVRASVACKSGEKLAALVTVIRQPDQLRPGETVWADDMRWIGVEKDADFYVARANPVQ